MILSIPLLAVVSLFLAPHVFCQGTSDKTLMQVLSEIPECQEYHQLLLGFPDMQTPPAGIFDVYCPRNEAVDRKLAEPAVAGSKVKRNNFGAGKSAGAGTINFSATLVPPTTAAPSATPTGNSSATANAPGKRQVTSVSTSASTVVLPSSTAATSTTPGSSPGASPTTATAVATSFRTSGPDPFAMDPNQRTVKSVFNDPAYVNLGPGEVLRLISFAGAPAFATTGQKLAGGLGQVVNVMRGKIPFNQGNVYVVDEFITLPDTISTSLAKFGQKIFLAALTKYNLIGTYEATPRITVFAPIDSSLSGELSECLCKQHVIEGPPLYTPDIVPGKSYITKAGGNITIDIKNGEYTLPGGATIVKANVITRNGVMHFINGTIPGSCEPQQFTGGGSKMQAWAGGLVGLVGAVVGILA
ncbi:FAS1 domain-containing protein [Choiromyces venosus 120613-1]|uniref:FAS1 domain-containing protein n=1 Tax=Choiromyces venosus 120613-1 TaxID=1336337 RepID=A0A3N4JSF5_9PEZI|nr:FAS1 domain-containing protein [Choiromyces venosus 120613-1]